MTFTGVKLKIPYLKHEFMKYTFNITKESPVTIRLFKLEKMVN